MVLFKSEGKSPDGEACLTLEQSSLKGDGLFIVRYFKVLIGYLLPGNVITVVPALAEG